MQKVQTLIHLMANTFNFTLGATAKDSTGNALESVSWGFSTLRRVQSRLFSNESLTGIAYSNNIFDGTNSAPRVGDSLFGTTDVVARSFFAFGLDSIPFTVKGEDIEFAELSIYKLSVSGNPYAFGSINLDHVNYGIGTDNSTGQLFNTPSLRNLGIFDDATKAVSRYHSADVTSAVRDDLDNRSTRFNFSHYRLAFPGTQVSQNGVQDFVFFIAELNAGLPDDKSANLFVSYLIP